MAIAGFQPSCQECQPESGSMAEAATIRDAGSAQFGLRSAQLGTEPGAHGVAGYSDSHLQRAGIGRPGTGLRRFVGRPVKAAVRRSSLARLPEAVARSEKSYCTLARPKIPGTPESNSPPVSGATGYRLLRKPAAQQARDLAGPSR